MGGKPRKRRSADEARALILDAAETQLRVGGPDSLRLQSLAADVGVSHPAILHHFGSREGLVQAVWRRTTERLEQQIYSALAGPIDETTGATLLDRLFRALGDPGNARAFAWLALTRGDRADDDLGYGSRLRDIADAIHRRRSERRPDRAGDFEDTLFTVLLATLAMLGNSLAGPALHRSAGLDQDADADRRFIVWLARLIHVHLEA